MTNPATTLRRNAIRATLALLVIALLAGPRDAHAQAGRNVVINGERIPENVLRMFEAAYRTRVANGRYWYDPVSGAWGVDGGPTAGLILPGLPLGGRLSANASRGTTGVYVNGRRLPVQDLMALQQLTGPIPPGRYWINGNGLAGAEGGPPLVDLRQLAARSSRSAWSHYTRSTDASVGGDGDFFYYIDRNTSMTGGR
jgi:hypothetical protein